ncbi:proton-dependent oligopeptide transporter family [Artemisia annua]|uniref:Proton-dependent oligopeptide transporter family n=1 Tax=Artemisia annua TaxID=35608 RepID=A0A2U1MBC2_ARTAN|nr:proton-dependent oligopeptide transporter family [Artemisia annua]
MQPVKEPETQPSPQPSPQPSHSRYHSRAHSRATAESGCPRPTSDFQVFRSLCKKSGKETIIRLGLPEMKKVIWYVLHNSPEIDAYMNEFQSERPDSDVQQEFPRWFESKIGNLYTAKDPRCTPDLFALACGPLSTATSINSCVVNGVKFVVHSRDVKRTTQNSGICSPGEKPGEMYYGQLEDILEFSYTQFKVVLFRVKWFDLAKRAYLIMLTVRFSYIPSLSTNMLQKPGVVTDRASEFVSLGGLGLGGGDYGHCADVERKQCHNGINEPKHFPWSSVFARSQTFRMPITHVPVFFLLPFANLEIAIVILDAALSVNHGLSNDVWETEEKFMKGHYKKCMEQVFIEMMYKVLKLQTRRKRICLLKVRWIGKEELAQNKRVACELPTFAFENMANLALAVNLVTYFNTVMHYDIPDSANHLTNFMGTGYILSIIMDCIADAYIVRFKTVLIAAFVDCLVGSTRAL